MNRRAFLGGAAGVWLARGQAAGQPAPQTYRIGYLGTATTPDATPEWRRFRHRLAELGYVEGRNVITEYRSSGGREEQFAALAAELVRLNVDVIVAPGSAAARAARDATATVPIVIILVSDPVVTGLVASLARPGGNVTGTSSAAIDISGKLLELLKELVPGLARISVLWSSVAPVHAAMLKEVEAAAKLLRLQVRTSDAQTPEGLERALAEIPAGRGEALLPLDGPFTFAHRRRIAELAARKRVAWASSARAYPEAGALMSYGASFGDLYYRAAAYVDKILKGAKPADLPVEQPTKFELVVNLKTARALGLKVPASFLQRADAVIQ